MANDFHYMKIRNMLSGDNSPGINLIIPPEDLTKHVPPPERTEDGRYNIVLLQPAGDERHTALGRFMDSWSKLEMALGQTLALVLKLKLDQTPALINSLGTRGIIDTIKDMAPAMLSDDRMGELLSLLDSVKENATRRNNLAHGFWMLEWFIRERRGEPYLQCVQYRAYEPTDAGLRKKIEDPKNKRERLRYMFTIKRILAISASIDNLAARIQSFNRDQLAQEDPKKLSDFTITSGLVSASVTKPFPHGIAGGLKR